MRPFAILLLLAGCAAPTPAQRHTLLIVCKVDTVAQPFIVALAPAVGPIGSAGAVADNMLVHPAVVSACALVNGVPQAVAVVEPATASVAVPVAAPVGPATPSVSGVPAP